MKYYVAFFINNFGFLQKKLKSFLGLTISDAWIYYNHLNIPFTSEENLPKEVYPPEQWYLHGSYCSKIINEETIEIPLRKGTSFRKIEDLFIVLASSYSWTLLPWGSIYSDNMLSSFIFISKELEIFNNFINSCSNVLSIKSYSGCVLPKYNLLISSYEVIENFSEVAKAIMIEDDFDDPGSIIWDACQLDTCPPLFVSQLYSNDDIDDFYKMSKADLESPFYWERADYKPLQIIEFQTREKSLEAHTNTKRFGICQPQDRQSFIELCRLQRQDIETILFFSYDTDIDKIAKLLKKVEVSNSFDYSDLSYMQDILQTTEWFYGLDRNNIDHSAYSLFVSKDNKLIQRIDIMNTNYKSKLISFF